MNLSCRVSRFKKSLLVAEIHALEKQVFKKSMTREGLVKTIWLIANIIELDKEMKNLLYIKVIVD